MTSDFSQRLRQLRLQKQLSQTELGKLAGIHYIHIGRYELGKSQPSADTLKRLAETLETSSDYLLYGDTAQVAQSNLSDKELLHQFQEVEKLPEEEKSVVKKLISAFLLQHQITEMATRRAS